MATTFTRRKQQQKQIENNKNKNTTKKEGTGYNQFFLFYLKDTMDRTQMPINNIIDLFRGLKELLVQRVVSPIPVQPLPVVIRKERRHCHPKQPVKPVT